MKRIYAVVLSVVAALGISLISAPVAHADSLGTDGYYDTTITYKTGQLRFESWVQLLYPSSGGSAYRAIGRYRLTDIQGIQAMEIRAGALRFENNIELQRDGTSHYISSPGGPSSLIADTNDDVGDNIWSTASYYASSNHFLRVDVQVAIRWGDGTLLVYNFGNSYAFWYRCANGTVSQCPQVAMSTYI